MSGICSEGQGQGEARSSGDEAQHVLLAQADPGARTKKVIENLSNVVINTARLSAAGCFVVP
jgi:hypothetical protein